uniref:Serine/threonine kinase 31 n=1 Tax=Hucho hucho TaxID=62062 RepID=A0A4W5L063_9TELE
DAITFWAQNVNDDQAIKNISNALANKCPTAQRLLGTPNPQKIYGAVFSEDSCWYRCKVLQQTDNFHVSYIDYGNTEFVSRSALVELPGDLQAPCLAKKYKFWGFNVSTDQDSAHLQQGKAFLQNLIYGKKVRIQKKSVCFNGTILVQAFQGNLDIGEEVLKQTSVSVWSCALISLKLMFSHLSRMLHSVCVLLRLCSIQFKGEMLQWQKASPTPDSLFSVKKRIRSLRAQLRWKQVEEASLEEAEDIDLTEILKKKEEIAETRNILFQEIGQERKEYVRYMFQHLSVILILSFICSVILILSFICSSGGLVVKSLDRDMFDAEPMKELSGRRPLVCTEFQGQRVILKGYTVNEEAEARVLERTTQFHRTRTQLESQTDTGILPLLALFFGKSDPLAYVMVPYFPNGSLWAVQAAKPLTATESVKVMRGVARGLQALHSAGVTHASLNPNNVFVLHRHQGMVGDYDFIKTPVQRAMDSGMVAGSISLVAPELRQTQGTPPTPACDMYSYGCLLFWVKYLHVALSVDQPRSLYNTRWMALY